MSEVKYFPTEEEYSPFGNETYDFEAEVQLFALTAEAFQEPNQRYHNWDEHVRTSFFVAMDLCDERESHEKPVNRLRVAVAMLGHDLGYSHYQNLVDLKVATGFDSKEAYSAFITENILRSSGYDPLFIEHVKQSIMATKLGEPCSDDEDKIVRLADMANTWGPFPGFIKEFKKLYLENYDCTGRIADPKLAIEQSCKIVMSYFTAVDLCLGPWHNVNEVVNRVKNNIEELREKGEDFIKHAS